MNLCENKNTRYIRLGHVQTPAITMISAMQEKKKQIALIAIVSFVGWFLR